jgi:hypothetical protein
MPSFATVTNGAVVQAQDVNQLVQALNGAAGLGVPLAVTAVNDSVNFAAAIKNGETTNSRALQVLRANNVVLLQADANGVVGSVDGIAAAAQLVNVSLAQTLTNKTISVASNTLQLTTASNTLAADVLLNNTGSYFDGPSMAQGTAGTWLAVGQVALQDTGGAANMKLRLWDGTTNIVATFQSIAVSSVVVVTLCGWIASPAGNIRISVNDGSATTGKILANADSSGSKSSVIYGVRIG